MPKGKQEFDNFLAEVDKAKKENGIELLLVYSKKLSETKFKIILIPAYSKALDKKALAALGFDNLETVSEVSQLASKFKSFEFTQTVSFGEKAGPARLTGTSEEHR
ncbi:MAG: hypothetical protein ACAI44_14890 [Candidatus Sericytochromatia bacterium]